MAGLVKPRSFPIRKITDVAQRIGRIFQQLRYPEQGGFTGASKWGASDEFKVTRPMPGRGVAESNRPKYVDD